MGSTPTSPPDAAATALFGSARRAVLGLLFDHPDQRFYQRQIVRSLALGTGAIQRELSRLTTGGILTRTLEGRQAYYQVNPASPIRAELHGLVRKTLGAAGVLRQALASIHDRIHVAFIYGSMARHQEQAASDIDVMVIGDLKLRDVSAALRPAQDSLQRELNPTVYPTDEFRRKIAARHHFLLRVLEEPKVFLIGGEDELKELGEIRLDQAAPVKPAGNRRPLRRRRP